MKSESNKADQTASKKITVNRIFGKICQYLARKVPFMPSKYRVMFQAWNGVCFSEQKTVFIGEDVYFDDIYPEHISVGSNVRITAGTKILTHFFDTKYEPTSDRPFRFYQGKVVISDYVFIGVNTVIAKPVTIGAGAVIGANSLITCDVPPNAIFVGVPAVQVGTRPEIQLEIDKK